MTPLFPALHPYETGTLHRPPEAQVYFERSGAQDAPTVLFVHGGPGSGAGAQHRRYFNPACWDIVLFDQRGCGRSRPLFDLTHNTLSDLIADMEALRVHLNVERWTLFGPSWGSTLALAYAQAHPDHVETLVVEGVLLGARAELDWVHAPHGAGAIHPDALARLMTSVPETVQRPAVFRRWAVDQMQSELARGRPALKALEDPDAPLETLRQSLIYRWTEYEDTLGWLDKTADDLRSEYAKKGVDWITAHSLLEAWYFSQDCFLEPGQLLAQAHTLTMPVHIIQSRYDLVCPGASAMALAKAAPHATLSWVEQSGHIMTGPVHREVRALFETLARIPTSPSLTTR